MKSGGREIGLRIKKWRPTIKLFGRHYYYSELYKPPVFIQDD